MCHQTIFSFIKCNHTAQALTICNEGILVPLQPCLDTWEGDFIQFDTICAGCQAVYILKGEKDGQCMPKDVRGVYDTMPFEYVVKGKLPWSQPGWDAQKPPRVNFVVWSEWDDWKIWDEQLSCLILGKRDAIDDYESTCLQGDTLFPPSTDEIPATQEPTWCRGHPGKQCDCSPQQKATQYTTLNKPSIKRRSPEPQQPPTCPMAAAAAAAAAADEAPPPQPKSKPRVRFLEMADVQYYGEDSATYLIKRGENSPTAMQAGIRPEDNFF